MQAAHSLNPWGDWHVGFVGLYLFFARRFDEALKDVREIAQRHPGFDTAQIRLSILASGLGLHDEALALVRHIEASPLPIPGAWLASAWLALGHRERALELLQQARRTAPHRIAAP